MQCARLRAYAHRAKFVKKVHKPPLGVNVIKFELNGFNVSISVFWSPTDPPKGYDALIKVFKVIGYVLIIFCTYSNISGNISFQYIDFPDIFDRDFTSWS